MFSPSYIRSDTLCSLNISVWAVALCAHAACKNFGGLFAVRFVLGVCEGSITAGFMIVSSMFYTRTEQTLRVGYWCRSLSYLIPMDDNNLGRPVLMNGTGMSIKRV